MVIKTGKKMPEKLETILKESVRLADIQYYMKKRVRLEGECLIIKNEKENKEYKITIKNKRVHLISFGKASQKMAEFALNLLGSRIIDGIVVKLKFAEKISEFPQNIKVIEANHPVPDSGSIEAAKSILNLISNASEDDLMLFLISGGGSAMVELPIDPITLEDAEKAFSLLIRSGATIHEINAVRKHISQIKGGKLAKKAYPAEVVSLIASDVPGNYIDVIASGPTAPDTSTYSDAYRILEQYEILDKIPKSVLEVIEKGLRGEIEETPKPLDKVFERAHNFLIAAPSDLAKEVSSYVSKIGYNSYVLTSILQGESGEVAKALSSIAIDTKKGNTSFALPTALILAGETNVKVKGSGKGGRAMELVAYFSREIAGIDGISIFAIDTDGMDGSTTSAGAFADCNTWRKIFKKYGLKAFDELRNNNSYELLDSLGYTIYTGPTGSNLNNLICILID
ncbi:glycerate kinase [Fervidicoccus fontis]|uniref:Glycerate kinase n=2 Tax=Fervidicoccus fontis TaxID=683846 RepID=A0A2J6N2C3_9CREN|nr:glycerate kinase [Fervidicoccus fontis]MBE9391482.1 glycerate kinase [Fervidicoccus fontis]PMB75487.1 MAG: glycerate kinase [Fervidicoccus fontis]PMB77352.1 MAG: glycerate kinase [Fervidicoccus fontis]HEW64078.1 glycerate kinase [Fervidicoccus fontis]